MKKTRNESGYTLLESLFQLIIAAAFLHLIILFLLFKESTYNQLTDSQTTEWELFMVDLQTDLSAVKRIELNTEGTILTAFMMDTSTNTEYSNVGGVIRRRVGSQGHVPLLTNVQKVIFVDEGPLLVVSVTLQDGTERQRRVAVGLSER
ncbi:ComGF family competence protein [Sporosarcina aquimarina]|uniref:competence type IV pilus minor pilin ComGF n=1 Tax=Sporosarcina aquimarina TaxID=114975 RepID=UPI00203F4B38|nr:competence type IV pilus minor pilin ComGF [Sporosarcina aquimarina]MCM3757011.1 ComGF family competence protein [Sporosarcina aquimarina]